jgi:hypothetical protein
VAVSHTHTRQVAEHGHNVVLSFLKRRHTFVLLNGFRPGIVNGSRRRNILLEARQHLTKVVNTVPYVVIRIEYTVNAHLPGRRAHWRDRINNRTRFHADNSLDQVRLYAIDQRVLFNGQVSVWRRVAP